MNNQIISGYHVCGVVKVDDRRGFGFAKAFGDIVRFEGKTGYRIVAGENYPEFAGGTHAEAPEVGDSIVVFVRPANDGWMATAWGSYQEFVAAQAVISSRTQCPKPAPALPVLVPQLVPVLQAAVSVSVQADKPNSTGRDRRGIFKPTTRESVSATPATPQEVCLEAVAKLESLPPAEATVECSTAPAQTETTELVAKR